MKTKIRFQLTWYAETQQANYDAVDGRSIFFFFREIQSFLSSIRASSQYSEIQGSVFSKMQRAINTRITQSYFRVHTHNNTVHRLKAQLFPVSFSRTCTCLPYAQRGTWILPCHLSDKNRMSKQCDANLRKLR